MIRKALLFCIILFLWFTSRAQVDSLAAKSDLKLYRISQREFLQQYGTDSASRVIINFYFHKRKGAIARTLFLPVPFALTTIAYEEQIDSDAILLPASVVFLLSAPVCIVFGVNGIISCVRYSRKNLFETLRMYANSGQIPAPLAENIQKFQKKHAPRRR
jgi:hypothetical protein